MCEKHFEGEKTNPFYENTGEDPAKFRNTEVGLKLCDNDKLQLANITKTM